MRAIGFYITDFVTDQRGFVVSDFDELVLRGDAQASKEMLLITRISIDGSALPRQPATTRTTAEVDCGLTSPSSRDNGCSS
jgi:hypothetical protein